MACQPPYAGVNLCVAIDMSGSLCSPDFSHPKLCTDCPNTVSNRCLSDGFTQDTCCPNFLNVLEFSEAVIAGVDADTTGTSQFSAVSFSTDATEALPLTDNATAASVAVGGIHYAGGFTNHGAAIAACRTTFENDASGNRNIVLLVTDGLATWPITENPQGFGRRAATTADEAGVKIHPVFINPDALPADLTESVNPLDPAIEYIADLSSDGAVTAVQDFPDLDSVVVEVVEAVGCAFIEDPANPTDI